MSATRAPTLAQGAPRRGSRAWGAANRAGAPAAKLGVLPTSGVTAATSGAASARGFDRDGDFCGEFADDFLGDFPGDLPGRRANRRAARLRVSPVTIPKPDVTSASSAPHATINSPPQPRSCPCPTEA